MRTERLIVKTVFNGSSASISTDLFEIAIEIEGASLTPPSTCNFALWLSLPLAMSAGRDLHISGAISPVAQKNAQLLGEIWSKWLPGLFRPIRVSADTLVTPKGERAITEDLMLYSGGLDSTYSLLKNYLNGKKPVSLLTIQGMDYKAEDDTRFNQLKDKIKPLTMQIRGNHYFIRSNAAEVMSKYGIDGGLGHGFHLFGCAHIFADDYSTVAIAADCTPSLDFIITPWGTNHLTNKLFASEQMSIRTLDNDIDRAEKTGRLARLEGSADALTAITFCKNRQSRPHNCGICSKCIRTKAMFYTETGGIPDIFSDRSFKPANLGKIDLSHRGERALVLDLLESARRNGKLDEFLWLEQQIRLPLAPKRHSRLKKLLGALRTSK